MDPFLISLLLPQILAFIKQAAIVDLALLQGMLEVVLSPWAPYSICFWQKTTSIPVCGAGGPAAEIPLRSLVTAIVALAA
jgi:hypothetical protein